MTERPSPDLQVRTDPLGGSALARAALAGATPEAWYPAAVRDREGWTRLAEATARDFAGRDWLTPLWPAIEGTGAAADRLRRTAEQGGVLVTTGQQPGLFGGPMLTWVKALSALALADAIERCTGRPAAPVFWSATDDADFEEARGTWVALPGGARRLLVRAAPPAGTPMSDAPLGDVGEELALLLKACGSAAFQPVLDAVREAYAPGTTIGGASTALLRRVLAPLGMAVLDASAPALRAAAWPVVSLAASRGQRVADAVAARTREIQAAGFTPQVAEVPGLSLAVAYEHGVKRRLTIAEGAPASGELGTTVLLRPVVERALLPTVAYCAGPGELAYFAQVSAVADALDLAQPNPVPRWSATVLEPQVARTLERLGLSEGELSDLHRAEGWLAREELPAAVSAELLALRDAATSASGRMATAGADLVPVPAVEGAARAIAHRIDRLERRFVAAAKRRGSERLHDLRTAHGALWPNGVRQERALNFVPLLARHGTPLLERMRAGAAGHAARLTFDGSERATAPSLATPAPGVPA